MLQNGKQVPEAAVRAPGQSSRHRVPSNANTSAPQQPATPLMQTSAGNGRSADTSISQRFPKLPAVFHNVLNHMLKAQAPTGDGEILASQRKACKSGSPWFYRFFRSQSARLNEKGGAGMQTYYFYPWQHGIRDIPMFHDLSGADKEFIRTALIIPARTRFQDFMATYQFDTTNFDEGAPAQCADLLSKALDSFTEQHFPILAEEFQAQIGLRVWDATGRRYNLQASKSGDVVKATLADNSAMDDEHDASRPRRKRKLNDAVEPEVGSLLTLFRHW